jgi:hypothetical protein
MARRRSRSAPNSVTLTRAKGRRTLETRIRTALLSCIMLVATASHAQISERTLTVAGLTDCITDAIATNSVTADGSVISFSCNAAKAKTLYNFLGKKIRAEVVDDPNGKFENRPFGSSACYHRIEDESGKTADEFRCDLIMAIGNILGDQ